MKQSVAEGSQAAGTGAQRRLGQCVSNKEGVNRSQGCAVRGRLGENGSLQQFPKPAWVSEPPGGLYLSCYERVNFLSIES